MEKTSVGIVHHFFGHYRKAVIRELIANGQYHYMFVGDTTDPMKSGIESCPIEKSRFIRTRCVFWRTIMVQAGMIGLALDKQFSTIIYMGDAQFLTTWISAALARLAGKRVLYWSHGWPRLEKGIKSWIRCLFYSIGNGMVLYSNRSKAIGVSKGFDPKTLHVIYNSLDYNEQKKWRSRITRKDVLRVRSDLFEDSGRPMLICTGRLVKYRHLDLLMNAMSLLKAQGNPVNLLLVGDGSEQPKLQALAAQNGLRQEVVFYGACYDEYRLAELIMAANATVIPGRVGLTAMHSFAYGVPVISHDEPDDQGPEWEAIVPGTTGDLYRYGDVADLARKIREWTSAEFVDSKIRSACYEIIEKFYNPVYQRYVMDQAVSAKPALDEAWQIWMPLVQRA